MSAMTPKERIDAVLAGQPVDRTPFALVDGGAWVAQQENEPYRTFYARPDSGASKIVEWTNKFETDIVSACSGVFTACLGAFGCGINIDRVGSPVGVTAAIKKPKKEIPLLDKSDIREKLLANEFVQQMLNQCRNVKELVGDQKYLLGDIAGPFTMACELVGTDSFMMMLVMNPEQTWQLLDYSTAISIEMFKLLHENGCDIALPAEPVGSGSMISEQMFAEFVIPGLKKLKEALPEYKYFFTHVCGDSGNRMPHLAEIGVNAFSCDYFIDVDKALEDGAGKTALFGNMNPAGALMTGTPEEVYEEACGIIKTANGRMHILATGCDMSSNTPLENVMMLSKACKDMAQA